jgi:hydrogenase expression/formation protein HypE
VLLATVPPSRLPDAEERLRELRVPYSVIGRVVPRADFLVKIGKRIYDKPYVEDKLFLLFA